MTRSLTVAVAQPRIEAFDMAGNADRHARAIAAGVEAGAGLVVFPELSLTGYEYEADPVEVGDPRLAPVLDACRRTGATALVGAPVTAGSRDREPAPDGETGPDSGAGWPPDRSIGVLAVDGDGARIAYRKQWLGEAERPHFRPGPAPSVIEVGGIRVGLAVCKDTGVPAHAEATARLGIDLYAAGVLEHEVDAGITPERARRVAAAHGVWVAVASFAGSTGEGYRRAAGGSGIWRPDGSAAATAGTEPGEVATATVTIG